MCNVAFVTDFLFYANFGHQSVNFIGLFHESAGVVRYYCVYIKRENLDCFNHIWFIRVALD